MTKEQSSTVPEELYNLTQLAEVTLAAGRLSTTNLAEIENYISKHQHNKMSSAINAYPIISPKLNVSMEKNNDGDDVSMTSISISPAMRDEAMTDNRGNDIGTEGGETIQTMHSPRIKEEQTGILAKQQAFYSSSSDDSDSNCYRYSHKVFDRRKSRRSTISEQSRFDEHSCSSTPSCSSDEQSNSTITTTTNNSDCHARPLNANISDGYASGEGSTGSGCGGGSSGLDIGGILDGDDHICPECGKKYSTSSNLARHRQTHRSIMDKKARRCPYCEKVYVSMPAYSMHVRTHSQGCRCDFCGKCFSRPWLLQGHIRTHTGEKPFKCSVCQKAFADKSNLRAHVQTHSNTKPHTCQRCGKAFALKSYLYKHEESSCMKNHIRGERSPDGARSSGARPSMAISNDGIHNNNSHMEHQIAARSIVSTDSAKSTLATKLLQKEKEKERERMQAAALRPPPVSIADTMASIHNPMVMASSCNGTPQKSYTTLTNSMSLEDYERFKRTSVIQSNITAISLDTGVPVDTINNSAMLSLAASVQEQPVDFSPKNQFTHSTKTSPFELTASYAMVA